MELDAAVEMPECLAALAVGSESIQLTGALEC